MDKTPKVLIDLEEYNRLIELEKSVSKIDFNKPYLKFFETKRVDERGILRFKTQIVKVENESDSLKILSEEIARQNIIISALRSELFRLNTNEGNKPFWKSWINR